MTNREKARAYYTAVNQYDEAAVEKLVDVNYVQHNPLVPTGRAAFVSLLPKLRLHGSEIKNLRMMQDGSYIVMHHHWKNAIPFGKEEMVAFHIIRFNGSGLIGEHWNVTAELGSPNPSGRTLVDGETRIENLEETERNKVRIVELFHHWTNGKMGDLQHVLPRYFHTDYHQHHPLAHDGIQGFIDSVRSGRMALEYTKQHKVLGEGNFVISISEGTHRTHAAACYDLFKFDQGKIAEHWNIYQDIPKANVANVNTMFNF